ncbi:Alpha/Beta hydrolase protein [Triangularia setosa]|uniref:Alpha/Beta hydrolase protein n=1 Tax=Triangularia setosa TaxID=2587417 RepID=A0AAN7A167_9PEZI|nr:Alpha/Beta hydrolase protein [Podospora setosa]
MAKLLFFLSAFLGIFTTLVSAQSTPFEMVTLIKIDYSSSELAEYYHRLDITYKTVNITAIKTAVLVPKKLAAFDKKIDAPVVVHLHGGGLIIGTNLEPAFIADWYLSFPIIFLLSITTNHQPQRLIQLPPNLNQIVTIGESAGGYLALQSTLLFQDKARIKAVIAQYPAIWPDLEAWKALPLPDPTSEAVIKANQVVDEYLGNLTGTEIRVDAPYPDRWELTEAGLLSGRSFEFWGNETAIVKSGLEYALNVSKQRGKQLPGIWLLQGENDGMVSKAGTEEFIARLKAVHPKAEVKYTLRLGLHGFDALYGLDKPFIAEGVKWVKRFWLQRTKRGSL